MAAFNGGLNSPYEYYLDILGSWPGSIPPSFSWFVNIDFSSVNPLQQNLDKILSNLEPNRIGWNISKNTTKVLLDDKYQNAIDGLLGCVFARSALLPGEIIEFDRSNNLSYAGLQSPATINNRKSYEPLHLTFTETTASFIDLILRPWLVATSYYGLIARSPSSSKHIKARFIDVVQLAKTGQYSKMLPRKIYRFINCAPVGLNGTDLKFDPGHLDENQVQFIYDSYSILEANTSSLITSL